MEAGEECQTIGYSYLYMKNYPMALEYLQKALDIKKHNGVKDKSIQRLKEVISKVEDKIANNS